jgi:co-chaperonin GroES (HSP10)
MGSYRIKPLPGQVLVEILPADTRSAGGIELPQHTPSPEENQQAAHRPSAPRGLTGVVKAIGAWPKLSNGMALMPEFGVGARVVIGPHAGLDMSRGNGERLKMVHQSQVLAVLQ